jgi:hypothetical protein
MTGINQHGEIDDGDENPTAQTNKQATSSQEPAKQTMPTKDTSQSANLPPGLSKRVVPPIPPDKKPTPPVMPGQLAQLYKKPIFKAAIGFFGALVLVALVYGGASVVNNPPATATPVAAGTATALAGVATAPVQSTNRPATTPTATSKPTPTPDIGVRLAADYTAGVAAYASQTWLEAAEHFQAIYDIDPNYLDVQDKLSATYYNWGVQLLEPQSAAEALRHFEAALKVNPGHTQAQAQATLVGLYVAARTAGEQQDWRESAIKLEELREIQADFLDSVAQLYAAYMSYGAALEQQGEPAEALRIYRKAVKLPDVDRSTADARIAELGPPVFVGQIFNRPTDAAVQCGTSFASKVWGTVADRNGQRIAGATVQVISADGKNRYSRNTNSQGGFEIPGLGCTTWRVRLIGVPNEPNGVQVNTVNVNLNGGLYSGAEIRFRQS